MEEFKDVIRIETGEGLLVGDRLREQQLGFERFNTDNGLTVRMGYRDSHGDLHYFSKDGVNGDFLPRDGSKPMTGPLAIESDTPTIRLGMTTAGNHNSVIKTGGQKSDLRVTATGSLILEGYQSVVLQQAEDGTSIGMSKGLGVVSIKGGRLHVHNNGGTFEGSVISTGIVSADGFHRGMTNLDDIYASRHGENPPLKAATLTADVVYASPEENGRRKRAAVLDNDVNEHDQERATMTIGRVLAKRIEVDSLRVAGVEVPANKNVTFSVDQNGFVKISDFNSDLIGKTITVLAWVPQ